MGYLITSPYKLASYQAATSQSDLTIYSQPLLDLAHADRNRSIILQKLAVQASPSKDEFNCSKLHEVHKLRIFKGECSRQNETVADRRGAGRSAGSFSIILYILGLLIIQHSCSM
jgi:hypothetical protein